MKKLLLLIFLTTNFGFGQIKNVPKPKGLFLADSVHLGEIINYSLVLKHDSKQEVFFMEKSYNYQPFEYVDKIYFPTKTRNGVSTDSAVYQLRTFNIDTIQRISIPVVLMKNNDSTLIYNDVDSVLLIHEVSGNINGLKLKDKLMLLPMKMKINMMYLFLQITIVLIAVFIWWLIFGKTVQSQFQIFTLYRKHNEFKKAFNRIYKTTDKSNIESAITLWKTYLGGLQRKPFNTMTTTEVIENIPNENLAIALKEIDKSIYGNTVSENISEAFDTLNRIADNYYNKQKKAFSLVRKKK